MVHVIITWLSHLLRASQGSQCQVIPNYSLPSCHLSPVPILRTLHPSSLRLYISSWISVYIVRLVYFFKNLIFNFYFFSA